MKININFINTGLDDRILKSLNIKSASGKTEKVVLVHDHKKGDYYRKQLVNVDQPESVKSHSTNKVNEENSAVSTIKDTLQKLVDKLKHTDISFSSVKLKKTEDDDPFFMADTQDAMWDKIEKLTKSDPAYKGYKIYDGENSINAELGSPNFRKIAKINPNSGSARFKKFDDSLESLEFSAIGAYTYSRWTYKLNNWLRGLSGKDVNLPKDSYETDVVKKITKHLDSAIDKYELRKPMVVYRSMRISALEHILSKGDGTFTDNGYASTSAMRNCFSLGDEPAVTLVIKVPAGKGHGAWLKPHSKIPTENEFLLARGTTFKINTMNIDYDKKGQPVNATLEVEVTGQDKKKLEPQEKKIDPFDFVDICEEPPEDKDDDQ